MTIKFCGLDAGERAEKVGCPEMAPGSRFENFGCPDLEGDLEVSKFRQSESVLKGGMPVEWGLANEVRFDFDGIWGNWIDIGSAGIPALCPDLQGHFQKISEDQTTFDESQKLDLLLAIRTAQAAHSIQGKN